MKSFLWCILLHLISLHGIAAGKSWTTSTIVYSDDGCKCHCGCVPTTDTMWCNCDCQCDGYHGGGDGSGGDGGGENAGDSPTPSPSLEIPTGALVPGLIKTNLQPMFEEEVPNALDPSFLYEIGESNNITVEMCESTTHRTGLVDEFGEPLMTSIFGYRQAGNSECTWPGMTFQVDADDTYYVQWENKIPKGKYILTGLDGTPIVDKTLHWAFSLPGYESYDIETDGVPVVTHLHGGRHDSIYDGNPEFFFTPDFEITGPRWADKVYEYHDKHAGCLWYHDHALGLTRLNVYAGMAGFYFVRDQLDTGKPDNPLNLPAYPYEAAYVIQDRMFKEDGSLFYPAFPGDPAYDDYITAEGVQLPSDKFPNGGPTALAEFFGDVMTVNGKVWPKADVEPRHYRLRLLNGCDSRFLIVQFVKIGMGETEIPPDAEPLQFKVIGTDHGFAYQTKRMDTLLIEPAARYDVIFNFGKYDGYRIVLKNIGPDEPFGGTYDPAGPLRNGTTFLRTDRIMAFDVRSPIDVEIPENYDNSLIGGSQKVPKDINNTRRVGLFEGRDQYGRLMPLLGNLDPATDYKGNPIYWPDTEIYRNAGLAGTQIEGTAAWHSPTTENPALGSTEEWEIWNFSMDVHPVHLHLVLFEVLGRNLIIWDSNTTMDNRVQDPMYVIGDGTYLVEQPIVSHDGSLGLGYKVMNPTMGDSFSPPSIFFEDGPKDMASAFPDQVLRIKANFDRPGHFTWHCHILSHEDHEMMRIMHVGDGVNDFMTEGM